MLLLLETLLTVKPISLRLATLGTQSPLYSKPVAHESHNVSLKHSVHFAGHEMQLPLADLYFPDPQLLVYTHLPLLKVVPAAQTVHEV